MLHRMKSEGSPACFFFFFFTSFWQSKSMFQCAFFVGLWPICCKTSISQEWFQNLFPTIHFSIQTYHGIPHLGVQQCCQSCHPPLPCIPLWVWHFSKHYTAFCRAFSVWLSFDSLRGSSAPPPSPGRRARLCLGAWGHPWGAAEHVRSPNLLFTFHSSTFFSWKIFNTEAIICSLFYYPWLFSVI